jgi:ubiquinone/menaquinone biosynthesis C-methylase UbiE
MPDYYSIITEVDPAIVANIANVLEIRAADPAQRRMLDAYLAEIDFPPNAHVLEVGCGTGAVARYLATRPEIGEVIGLDPSSHFIETAQRLAGTTPGLRFVQGSAHDLSHLGETFDVIIFHTTLCHLSRPENALSEAFHALRPGGWLAVFDGDYASTTLGTDDIDPLQLCAEAFRAYFIDNSWIGRLTPKLASDAGFATMSYRSHGYTESGDPNYMLTIVDRGADALAAHGKIGTALAAALKAEARQRVEEIRFFGHISYTSLIARKPDPAATHRNTEAT